MLLAIDIGNSDVVLGLGKDQEWQHVWRIRTMPQEPALAYELKIVNHFLEADISPDRIDTVVLSSVVPSLSPVFKEVIAELFGKKPVIVRPETYPLLQVQIDNPYEIGSDLFANAVAAYSRFRQNCIVVDFGTALTFTTVSGEGELLGVAIAPGLQTAIRALSQNTAKLPAVPLEMPGSAIGKNTVQAMQAGVLMGYVGLVESLLTQIRKELQDPDCLVIATGGLSSVLSPLQPTFHTIISTLTLDGIRIIGEYAAQQQIQAQQNN